MDCAKFDFLPVGTILPASFSYQLFNFTSNAGVPTSVRSDNGEKGIKIMSNGMEIGLVYNALKVSVFVFIGDGGALTFRVLDKNRNELLSKKIIGHGLITESLSVQGIRYVTLEKNPVMMEETLISVCVDFVYCD